MSARKTVLLATLVFSTTLAIEAAPALGVGTPANAYLATPSGVSPRFGTLINFDELTPNTSLSSTQYISKGVGSVSSPDGLTVVPFSTQSGPNEIFDPSTNGTADIVIRLTGGVGAIGVGIADIDPVTLTFQALNASGNPFGTAFSINIATTGDPTNPGNGYYLLRDTTPDIYGFLLTQSVANSNYSGLAIDDVQFAPEPASTALVLAGALICVALAGRRKQF